VGSSHAPFEPLEASPAQRQAESTGNGPLAAVGVAVGVLVFIFVRHVPCAHFLPRAMFLARILVSNTHMVCGAPKKNKTW
jgi:hypothetical protein